MNETTQAKFEVVLGGGLVGTPWWATWMESISFGASMVAAVCGAIVGLHAVYRLIKRRQQG